jgi:ATP-dependent Clp protease ATP-binding subunit ClpC
MQSRLSAIRSSPTPAVQPVARLLFRGPTGVGKSSVTGALSEFLFGDLDHRLKIDGGFYGSKPSSGELETLKELLIRHIERYPFNIILLDEYEKMHPDYRNIILGVADGRITDKNGRSVKTNLNIIIATTNTGSRAILSLGTHVGFSPTAVSAEDVSSAIARATRDEFAPEQIGRFSRVLDFNPLTPDVTRTIVENHLSGPGASASGSILTRFQTLGIRLEFDESVIAYMSAAYFDDKLGARKLADNIEALFVTDFLSRKLQAGEMVPGRSYRVRHMAATGYVLENGD